MGNVTHATAPSNEVKNKWTYTSAPPTSLQGVNRDNFTPSIIPYHNSIKCCVAKDVIKKWRNLNSELPHDLLLFHVLKRIVFISVLWQIITYYILHWFRSTWAPRIELLSLVSGLQLFIYLFRHSSHFKDFLTHFHSRLISHFLQDKTQHSDSDDAMFPTVYSRPADPLLPQQIHHADKHTIPAVTASCINALLLLETSNYASTANLRSLVSAHIVVSSKQQLKTVTWLPLVLPIVTCTCFLSQPRTVTSAKLRLQASVFDDEYLATVLYSFAWNWGVIHSTETWSRIC
jgi:hypothetical protein